MAIKKSKESIKNDSLIVYLNGNDNFLTKNRNKILSIYDSTPGFIIESLYNVLHKISLSKKIKEYNNGIKYDLDNLPLFRAIEIETINRCNGKCSFCPVNIHNDPRPYAKMDFSLFKKIIGELKDLNYSGPIALFSNNEPFLDERIPDFIKYGKTELPNADFYLLTNGTLLTIDKLKACINYLTFLTIDNYNDDLELNINPKKIYDYCNEHPELLSKVSFAMRLENQVLTSRGGNAPNKNYSDISYYHKVKCHYPFGQLVIRPDGKISICCNDPLGKYTMGDVSKDKLIDIWYSEKYTKIRKEMLKNGRKNLYMCKDCDTMNPIFTIDKKEN